MITHKSVQIVWFFQERKNNDIYLELFNDLKKKKTKTVLCMKALDTL